MNRFSLHCFFLEEDRSFWPTTVDDGYLLQIFMQIKPSLFDKGSPQQQKVHRNVTFFLMASLRSLTRWVATSYVKMRFRIGAKLISIYEDEKHLAWAASIYSPRFSKDKRYIVLFEMHSTELDGSNFVIQYTSLHFRVFLNNFRQARPLCSGLDYNEDIWGCGCTPPYDYCD